MDKVGQNCVDFGERIWYDINVPRKARGCSAKTLSSFFRATRRNRAALFVTKKGERRNGARSPARKKSETVLNCKIYRLIMVYAIGASAFLQVGFVMVREESIPSTDLSKNADAHATKVW